MNKQELVASMALKSELTKKDSAKALEAFEETVMETLAKGEKVSMMGFGTFKITEQKGKEGVMRQADKTEIPWKSETKNVPKFKASQALNDAVKGE